MRVPTCVVRVCASCSSDAAACSEICYTTELRGFAPGGIPGCTCSGSEAGARTGAGGCNCGQCYEKTQGVVDGFAINTDGTCTYGTDCGSCEYSRNASSSSSTDTGSSFVTATPSPVLASNGSSSTMNATSTGRTRR
ncbi:unnamed protein product [Phytophthora lilii]|uniref:Unnamed protein product n=1 Tax=Phytophthora lilii TaxID=2077276 RepID=A0A9W6X2R7_9STRA|nr:unnamed protein product [Phytophthora lilii]